MLVNSNLDPKIKKQLKKEDLRYVSDQIPGFFRQKLGEQFRYYNLDGKKIMDKKTLERIDNLAIPPAWRDVWISPVKNGHLQTTGIDDKSRKQYIYHSDWIKITQTNKFDKMINFGLSLPKIRGKVAYDLRIKKLEKKKILATVLWLLEHTFIRIGNEEYFRENNSFGLTTLRNRHVDVKGSSIFFSFKGKSGVSSHIEVTNPTVVKTIKKCIELPGYELFQFIDAGGSRHVIDSENVNLFLKDLTNDDFSAKDFRTWGATKLSANNFYHIGDADDKKSLTKNIAETVKKVAKHLSNTVSVCKNYYIHPAVILTYQSKTLVSHFKNHSKSKSKISGLSWDEYALIKLLQNN